jgi:hypothetical protein
LNAITQGNECHHRGIEDKLEVAATEDALKRRATSDKSLAPTRTSPKLMLPRGLHAFFVDDVRSRTIPPNLEARLFRKPQMIDDATTDQDLTRTARKPLGRSCAAIWRDSIRSASTSNDG